MTTGSIDGPQLTRMEQILDLLAQRQRAITANLANADTPGYKAIDVRFRDQLEGALEGWRLVQTSPDHFEAEFPESSTLEYSPIPGLAEGPDGNNVELDRELLAMTLNRLRFQMAVQGVSGHLRSLRLAIREGQS